MKILIIEDEQGILSFLVQGLQEEGFNVESSNNGKLGFEMALNQHFDLLILDWMLPDMSGIEICNELRKSGNHVPIIFLTAKDTVEDTINGLSSGANDYLKKPFHFEELLARVHVQLRQNSKDDEKLSLSKIKIDPTKYEVLVDGIEVNLTHKEFDLLYYLIKNKERVCSRKGILNDVWDIHFDYDSSVIDVYINSLRKKLDLKSQNDHIHTIRGVGYMIKEN